MNEWQPVPLADLLDVQNGYAFSSEMFSDSEGMPLLRIRDLKTKASPPVRYSGEYDEKYLVQDGDLLIGMDGEFACYEWGGGAALLNQRVCRLVNFSERLEPRFLLYGINKFLRDIEDDTSYTTVKHLSSKTIKEIQFPLPPLDEQKRIVAVLDQAFAALDRAGANAEANLEDARGFFLHALRSVFSNRSSNWASEETPRTSVHAPITQAKAHRSKDHTRTGGREATARPIHGNYSLSVLSPTAEPRKGWTWSPLSALATLESGHTPSRRHPEYWEGDIHWISIRDAKENDGETIERTREQTNALGISKSSARVLPKGTVCLSRTASVGYVVKMGTSMATSQDFVNWICGPNLDPEFLMLLLQAQGDEIRNFASGAVHQTIYFPEVKAFHVCHPAVQVQREISGSLKAVKREANKAEAIYVQQVAEVDALRHSLLQAAFSGQLT